MKASDRIAKLEAAFKVASVVALILDERNKDQRRLLGRCRSELQSIMVDINDDRVPFDGDDFHELLRDIDDALEPKPQLHAYDIKI
jgi:hypothetical protein